MAAAATDGGAASSNDRAMPAAVGMLKHNRPSWEWEDGVVLADANGDAVIVEAAD